MATAYSPDKLEAILRQFMEGLKVDFATTIDRAIDKAFDKSFHHLSQTSPPAQKPCAQTTTPELPPQPTSIPDPTPAPARSYPPSPSVETIEEVELKQVYKIPLRNIRKRPIEQKHRASKTVSKTVSRKCVAEFLENWIAWPPRFGGIYICFSRDEEPDAWYTTMLNHKQKLIEALPNPA